MYTAIIVEDELNILKHMNKLVVSMDEFLIKGTFATPHEALAAFPDLMPDVAFIDIEMPRMNGLELARRLLKVKDDLSIIFTTAYGQYALDAFEVEAIDYLMKPIMKEELQRVLKRLNRVFNIQKRQSPLLKRVPSFAVRCFGAFEVRDQQQQMVRWPTRKAEEVFAYFLANQGRYISKWELLKIFWPEIEEERAIPNLYNTIYRVKQVLKKLPLSPKIQKINEGYILEAQRNLSDLGEFLEVMKQSKENSEFPLEASISLFFSYATPLFGDKDYFWSLHIEKYVAQEYGKLCHKLLLHYYEQNQLQKGEEIIQHYMAQYIEDEDMLRKWLKLVAHWQGYEEKSDEYRHRFNEKLASAELPLLE